MSRERTQREIAAYEWACDELNKNMRLLCSAFEQDDPILIEPDDEYVLALREEGIGPDSEPFGGSVSWLNMRDFDFKREHLISYFDEKTQTEKSRTRTIDECFEYVHETNRQGVGSIARSIFDWHVRSAATALQRDIARREVRVAPRAEAIDTFGERVVVSLLDTPLGPLRDWCPWITRSHDEIITLATNWPSPRELLCAANAVDVCLVKPDTLSGYGVRTRQWSTIEEPWPQGVICDMIEVKAAPRIVLKPRDPDGFVVVSN